MALRKITVALTLAVGMAFAGAGIAHADIAIDNSSSGTGNNVLFQGTQTTDATHPVIYGILNANNPQVVGYSTTSGVTLTGTGSSGQATITASGGVWNNLTTIVYTDSSATAVQPVSVEVFSLVTPTAGGSVTIDAYDQFGTKFSQTFNLKANANNFFTLTALPGETIQSVTFNTTVGLADFEHNRIDLAQVPVPPAAALFGSGLAGLLLLGRRKLRKAAA